MNIEVENHLAIRCINCWGENEQLFMIVEELSELIHAISKWRRNPTIITKKNIVNEIADVFIMLEQLYSITKITQSQLQGALDFKEERLEERVNRWEAEE